MSQLPSDVVKRKLIDVGIAVDNRYYEYFILFSAVGQTFSNQLFSLFRYKTGLIFFKSLELTMHVFGTFFVSESLLLKLQ